MQREGRFTRSSMLVQLIVGNETVFTEEEEEVPSEHPDSLLLKDRRIYAEICEIKRNSCERLRHADEP